MSISAIQNIFRNTKAQWDTDYMLPNDTAPAAYAGKDDEGNNNNDIVRLSLRNNNMHMPRNKEQQ